MEHSTITDLQDLPETGHYQPAVSIVMPFEPKMSVDSELRHRLKLMTDKVGDELRKDYTRELADLVLLKLKNIIQRLNFNTFRKSIAIYVSPVFEAVFYLDIEVEEKLIIDESFEIRDLVYAKKEARRYLILVLSGKRSKVYLHYTSSLVRLKSNVPDHIAALENDLPERTGNFSDPSHEKEVLLKRFLRQTDNGLTFLLKAYPFPVFVLGAPKVLGYFREITKNPKALVAYVPGNYEQASETELNNILAPYINDWKKVKTQSLLQMLETADKKGKLAKGIVDVWKEVSRHKGRLLVVERNFLFCAQKGSEEEVICRPEEPYNKFSCIKDAVDDLIEKVLQDGGDVEFTDDGALAAFNRIALVQYY